MSLDKWQHLKIIMDTAREKMVTIYTDKDGVVTTGAEYTMPKGYNTTTQDILWNKGIRGFSLSAKTVWFDNIKCYTLNTDNVFFNESGILN
jgi:hypothetical protein